MLALGLILLTGMALTTPRRRVLLLCAGTGLVLFALAGCGGGGGGGAVHGSGGTPPSVSTPKGTSAVTITATYSDPTAPLGPVILTHTAQVILKVQ